MKYKLDVIKYRFIAIIPPALILLGALIIFFTLGFNRGIDFDSGLSVRVRIEGNVEISNVRDATRTLSSANVQTLSGEGNVFQIKTKDTAEVLMNLLYEAYGANNVTVLQSDFVGPKFSSNLLSTSVRAVLIAVVLILIYIWIRFRLSYALSSILALCHDVLMMLSFILIFRLEVSSTTIAALLTIIGYSLNNTIVIFDRVRENVKIYPFEKVDNIINLSVSQSLSRTLITTGTTLFAVIPLAIFTTGTIQTFAINLIWGLISGAYSSTFLAPSLLHWLNPIDPINKKRKKKEEEGYHIGDAYV